MVEANPEALLAQKLQEVQEAANLINQERHEFAKLQVFEDPPRRVDQMMIGLHCFYFDLLKDDVEWPEVKLGPIFQRQFNLNVLDYNRLKANQVEALSIIEEFSYELAEVSSISAAYVYEYFSKIKAYLEFKESIPAPVT